MFKSKFVLCAIYLLLGASSNALAAKGGGGSPGGMSLNHMSSVGKSNTNGPMAADRDKGLQRAEDRRSAAGTKHSKSSESKAKGKRQKTASPPTL